MRPRKRLFIGILGVVLLFITLTGGAVWYLTTIGLSNIHRTLPYFIGSLFLIFIIIIGVGISAIVFSLCFVTPRLYFRRLTRLATELLYPGAVKLSTLCGIQKEKIEESFIEVNNQLLLSQTTQLSSDELLLIAPHCLQKAQCSHKITSNLDNCQRCGGCPVDGLLQLGDKYKLKMAVVTGGTLARKIIKDLKPKAVIAIACERDLTSGIQDMHPLPVLGVLNERPNGPCFNTQIDLDKVEKAILQLTERRD